MIDNFDTHIDETTDSLMVRIIKSKLAKVLSGICVIVSMLLFLLPFLFDNSELKFQLEQKISQICGVNFIIGGEVKISLIPAPTIIAEDVLLQNYQFSDTNSQNLKPARIYNLYAKSLKIRLPILKLYNEPLVKKIILTDAVLESYRSDQKPLIRKNKFVTIATDLEKKTTEQKSNTSKPKFAGKPFFLSEVQSYQTTSSKLPDIIIKNGEIIFYDRLARQNELSAINAKARVTDQKIKASGSWSSALVLSNFNLLANFNSSSKKPDSLLSITSPILELKVRGNFTSEKKGLLGSDFNGKLAAEIFELKSFYKTYLSNKSVISDKLKNSTKPIKISADINNQSSEIAITNLLINSNLFNGKGEIGLNFVNQTPLIDIALDLENLDLDSIWSNEAVMINIEEQTQNSAAVSNSTSSQSDNPIASDQQNIDATNLSKIASDSSNFRKDIKDFDLTSEIKIKNAKYLDGEIKDIDLYLTVSKEGQILILPMIFKLPGNGIFRVNGVFDNNAILPKFIGKFDAQGEALYEILSWLKIESQNLKFKNLENYQIYSDLMVLPNNLAFDNFYLNCNESEFLGEIKIDKADKVKNIATRFQINSFNVDDYFLISGQNAYLSPGSLLKKLLWLNDLSSNNSLDLQFDSLNYKGEEFPQQSLKMRFGQGYFELINFNLKSPLTNLTANLIVDISGKNQKFDLKVSSENFHYQPSQISQPKNPADFKNPPKQTFLDQFFALPSLQGFDGNIALIFNNLQLGEMKINDLQLIGKLRDGSIVDSNLTCGLYDGILNYHGLIGIKFDKIFNGNVSFSNVSLQPLLSDLLDINNVSGVANVSASITTSANKKHDFTKELVSEVKFNSNAPTVTGYGLSDLVKKMFDPSTYSQELRQPEEILFNPQSKTVFKQAEGEVQINKGSNGKFRIKINAPAINGILSGKLDANNQQVEGLFNVIFLTGNRNQQTPINIATNLSGELSDISQSTNIDQVKQYLGLAKPNETINSPAQPSTEDENIPKTTILPGQDIPNQQITPIQ